MAIEIHLDGRPVTKLEAARAVSVVGARGVRIGFPAEGGTLEDSIDLYGRSRAYGEIEPPLANSSSFGGDAGRMRRRAQVLTLAAEVAELGEMIAAEQGDEDGACDDLPETCAWHGGEGSSGPGCPDCAYEDEQRREAERSARTGISFASAQVRP